MDKTISHSNAKFNFSIVILDLTKLLVVYVYSWGTLRSDEQGMLDQRLLCLQKVHLFQHSTPFYCLIKLYIKD